MNRYVNEEIGTKIEVERDAKKESFFQSDKMSERARAKGRMNVRMRKV